MLLMSPDPEQISTAALEIEYTLFSNLFKGFCVLKLKAALWCEPLTYAQNSGTHLVLLYCNSSALFYSLLPHATGLLMSMSARRMRHLVGLDSLAHAEVAALFPILSCTVLYCNVLALLQIYFFVPAMLPRFAGLLLGGAGRLPAACVQPLPAGQL